MPDPEIIITRDGSHSLLNTTLNETYHSVYGAVQESKHVFIEQGLRYHVQNSSSGDVNIFEVGFGTGLNALLAMAFAKEFPERRFSFTTCETFPLPVELLQRLNYRESPETAEYFDLIHECGWDESVQLLENFRILKYKSRLQDLGLSPLIFDVVFYDAFAPSRQPEMWEKSVLAQVERWMKRSGTFVTYCAKGQLKRDLKSLGFRVETLPGPPGKKEMVRALKDS